MAKRGRKPRKGNNSPTQAQQNVLTPSPCPDRPNAYGDRGLTTREELRLHERAIKGGWNLSPEIMEEAVQITRQNIHSESERISNIAIKNLIAMAAQDQRERLVAKHVPTVADQDDKVERLLAQLDAMDATLPIHEPLDGLT